METYTGLEAEGIRHRIVYEKGYCLREAPELLSPEGLEKGLSSSEFGRHIVYRERVDSTNNVAKQMADDGAPEGTVVIAEEQTGGRGVESFFPFPLCQGLVVLGYPAAGHSSHGSL